MFGERPWVERCSCNDRNENTVEVVVEGDTSGKG